MTILIIDTSVQIIERMESLLLEADDKLHIHNSRCFDEATRLFIDIKPEVVLLDMSLPGNKSFSLLKSIKEISNNTCIIALSTHIPFNIREQCRQLGADYFLDKYNDFDKIPGLIKWQMDNQNHTIPITNREKPI